MPHFFDLVLGAVEHEADNVAASYTSVEDAAVDYGAAERVIMGIEDQSGQGRFGIAFRRGNPLHDGLKNTFYTCSLLCRAFKVAFRVQSKFRIYLFDNPFHVRCRDRKS